MKNFMGKPQQQPHDHKDHISQHKTSYCSRGLSRESSQDKQQTINLRQIIKFFGKDSRLVRRIYFVRTDVDEVSSLAKRNIHTNNLGLLLLSIWATNHYYFPHCALHEKSTRKKWLGDKLRINKRQVFSFIDFHRPSSSLKRNLSESFFC